MRRVDGSPRGPNLHNLDKKSPLKFEPSVAAASSNLFRDSSRLAGLAGRPRVISSPARLAGESQTISLSKVASQCQTVRKPPVAFQAATPRKQRRPRFRLRRGGPV